MRPSVPVRQQAPQMLASARRRSPKLTPILVARTGATHLGSFGLPSPQFELAILDYSHTSIPEKYRKKAQGVLINVEVVDVDTEYLRLKEKKLPMLLDIRSEEWGQRHFIVEDPNGILIDVIQNIEPSAEFMEEYRD